MEKFKTLGCKWNVKLHFLYGRSGYFPENLGNVNEEPSVSEVQHKNNRMQMGIKVVAIVNSFKSVEE